MLKFNQGMSHLVQATVWKKLLCVQWGILNDRPRDHHLWVVQLNANFHRIFNVYISVNNVVICCLTVIKLPWKCICNKLTWKKEQCVLHLIISHVYNAVSFRCGINSHLLGSQWAEWLWNDDSHITVFYTVKVVPTLK
jgi:hypothetical protein